MRRVARSSGNQARPAITDTDRCFFPSSRKMVPVRKFMRIFTALAIAAQLLQAAGPIPFSHKQHSPLKLDCVYCHATAKTGDQASYPEASVCMTCHQEIAKEKPDIRRLAALPKTERIEPERSVYVLADFAFFSHARHGAAKVKCQTCHGEVYTMDVVDQVLPMTMKACVNCHRTSHAPTKCNTCHELGQ